MKEKELRQFAACSLCGLKIGHTGLPLFWVIRVERYGVDMRTVERQQGLGMFLGDAALAQAMGPDEDIAKPLLEPVTLSVCEVCACMDGRPVAALAELKGALL